MIIDRFQTYLRAERRYSPHTVMNYGRDVRRFFADMKLDEESFDPELVTSDDIRTWIISLSEAKLSATSVNRMTSSLRAFFRWLRKCGEIEGDPFVRINFQRTPSRLPAYVTETQMEQVLDAFRVADDDSFETQRSALMILIFYSTGMRLAELAGIRLNDFSPGYRELRVRGKGGKERIIPVMEVVRREIELYVERIKAENIWSSDENSLFLNNKGRPVSRSQIYATVKQALERAGVQGKRSPHVLRHTFATHMLNDGADIREIQELLGHSSLSATQIYTHNSISQLREAYKGAHPRERKK